MDAVEQAGQVLRGERTASGLVSAAIARVERLNPHLNAVIHPLFDKALRQAADPDAPPAPFRGVPLLLKDALCHTAGDPYHVGMRLLRDRGWSEPTDTHLAARFRRAGFVVVGRTNTPELATAFTTEPLAYGPTRNPWDPRRSAGGSSGGSAAAVAAGIVAVAHGNDMGGSIRVPASQCGVVGLKPSHGRTSLGPDFGDYWAMLTHEGVLTRTVRDTAAVLDEIAGPSAGDPVVAPRLLRPLREEVAADTQPLRIAFRTTLPVERTAAHPECVRAVETVVALLEAHGHVVSDDDVPALDDDDVGEHFGAVFTASVARDLERWGRRLGVSVGADDVEPRNWLLAERGRAVSVTQYIAAVEYLQGYARRVASAWDDVGRAGGGAIDVLVTPTIRVPPPTLGWLPVEPTPEQVADLGQFTSPFNVTGQPALSLPLHWTDEGLPIGVQLVAAYGREDVLVRLAARLEEAAPWAHRYPPMD